MSQSESDPNTSLVKLATDFRAAIERCPRTQLPIGFGDFPAGACGDTSLLLAKYLESEGHVGFIYVLGMRDGGSHAWLRRENLIIDIAADQFEDQDQTVIVATNSTWHHLFRHDSENRYPEDFDKWDRATAVMLWNAYRAVVRQLLSEPKARE